MPTLFNRIYAYTRTNKLPMLTPNQRSELGVKAMELFKKSNIKKRYTWVKAKPFDFDGIVVYYPSEFTEILDSLIKFYCDNPPIEPFFYVRKYPEKNIQIPTPIPIKKRRVIRKKGELVYSTKNQ